MFPPITQVPLVFFKSRRTIQNFSLKAQTSKNKKRADLFFMIVRTSTIQKNAVYIDYYLQLCMYKVHIHL